MRRTTPPGLSWLVGVLMVATLAGGVAQVVAYETEPVVETTVVEREVLPEGQAEVTGKLESFLADEAVGAPLAMPIDIAVGRATIDGAIVEGERATIVWDGGRPFRLGGAGAVDLGPTRVRLGWDVVSWSLDGLRLLTPGEYRLDTPVAVGTSGLARPRDSVVFIADEETTLTSSGGAVVGRPLPIHLEGPGSVTMQGRFAIRTRDGTRTASSLDFGPGPFVLDVAADGTFTAAFNGDLTST